MLDSQHVPLDYDSVQVVAMSFDIVMLLYPFAGIQIENIKS